MNRHSFLAFDIGAESGRTIVGSLEDQRLKIREINRFPNGMIVLHGHYHWNIFRLFEEMKRGLELCAAEDPGGIEGMAFDTWGVDFALLTRDGTFLGLPFAYRDPRTENAMDRVFEVLPAEKVYALTGIQFMPFNSLFQLFAARRDQPALLDMAEDILFMPDIFNFLFTGERKTEFTYATTSQLFNPVTRKWEDELFEAIGVPKTLMQQIVEPGTAIGELDPVVCRDTGINAMPVLTTASHDTGSAVAAVPAEGDDWAYISSGTWSLMGVEVKKPILTEEALRSNFTNEGGVGGTFRFLKNITGLWLLQQCRRSWSRERSYDYGELMRLAGSAEPFKAVVDPDSPQFLNPDDMPEAIRLYCRSTGQPEPASPAEFSRAILESLALKYSFTLEQILRIRGNPVNRIHIIGGGSENSLLCQFTANATGLPVMAGPKEATAIGNIMVQALGLGLVPSHAAMREVIRLSFEPVLYEPRESAIWDAAKDRFRDIGMS